MKLISKASLAVFTALALTAMLTAATASASELTETVLCKKTTYAPYCAVGDRYPAKTAISASPAGSNVTIKMPIGNVVCSQSTISGETSAGSGEPLPVSVSAWSLEGCKLGGSSCTVSELKSAPYAGALNRTHRSDGTLYIHSGGSGNPGWNLDCPAYISCTLTTEPTLSYQGEGTPRIVANEATLTKKEGFLCPKWAKLTGTYTLTTSTTAPLAVAKEAPSEQATALCSTASDGLYCEPANLYASGTHLKGASTTMVLDNPSTYGLGDLTCEANLEAETTANYGEPLPVTLDFSVYNCKTSGGAYYCTVEISNYGKGGLSRENGDAQWTGFDVSVVVSCNSTVYCTYIPVNSDTAMLFHGQPATVETSVIEMTASGSLCPKGASYLTVGNFALSSPSGFMVASDALR